MRREFSESLGFSSKERDVTIYKLRGTAPQIAASAFVAQEATVIGQVSLADNVSVWPGAVIRGDNDSIEVGEESNVQ